MTITANIAQQFTGLWKQKVHGDAIEVITPFVTAFRKFVSVFISKYEGQAVVSDGGWMSDETFGVTLPVESVEFEEALAYYLQQFEVKKTVAPDGRIFYYKKTPSEANLPSLILDMCSFITGVMNAADIGLGA